jgi:hypothetical protein
MKRNSPKISQHTLAVIGQMIGAVAMVCLGVAFADGGRPDKFEMVVWGMCTFGLVVIVNRMFSVYLENLKTIRTLDDDRDYWKDCAERALELAKAQNVELAQHRTKGWN